MIENSPGCWQTVENGGVFTTRRGVFMMAVQGKLRPPAPTAAALTIESISTFVDERMEKALATIRSEKVDGELTALMKLNDMERQLAELRAQHPGPAGVREELTAMHRKLAQLRIDFERVESKAERLELYLAIVDGMASHALHKPHMLPQPEGEALKVYEAAKCSRLNPTEIEVLRALACHCGARGCRTYMSTESLALAGSMQVKRARFGLQGLKERRAEGVRAQDPTLHVCSVS